MRIKQKLIWGFLGIALLIGVVGYFSVTLSKQIFGLRTVELPMEQNLREVEVSIWEAIHAADSFRLTGHEFYEELYNKQIGDVDEFYTKYQALTDTDEEKKYIEEFNTLWEEAKTAGNKIIELTKKQKAAEEEFFINTDEADDVIDFAIQSKWSPDAPNLLAKEQAVREVEVSIWEAIHAGQQYLGLAGDIVRGGQKYLGMNITVAAAKASLVKGDFKAMMEKQFEDVDEFWTKYKALPHEDFEATAIQDFDGFWEKAVIAGREVVSLHDQTEEQFNILFEKVDKADEVLDFKMQEFIQKRIERQDETAKRVRTITIAMVLFTFFSAIGVGLFIARSIANPLTKLKDAAVEIGEGKLDTKIEIKSKDEIGDLANSFKKMAEELSASMQKEKELAVAAAAAADAEKKRAEESRAANQQLEASEQQLKAANQQLVAKEQVLRKSQEVLTSKMDDLERFNRLMVGRELEMVKLKGEVNSLLEKSGQSGKYEAPEKIKEM